MESLIADVFYATHISRLRGGLFQISRFLNVSAHGMPVSCRITKKICNKSGFSPHSVGTVKNDIIFFNKRKDSILYEKPPKRLGVSYTENYPTQLLSGQEHTMTYAGTKQCLHLEAFENRLELSLIAIYLAITFSKTLDWTPKTKRCYNTVQQRSFLLSILGGCIS